MYQYILFDLDGTLTDPAEGITKSVQYALEHFGVNEENLRKLEKFIGPPLNKSFQEFYGMPEKTAEKAVEKYRERFSKAGIHENELYPGIDSMLKNLKEQGKKLAIASSKPTVFVEKILKNFKIDTYFDIVMGSELDGTRSDKQEVIKAVLAQFFEKGPVDLEHTVMVGDRKFDVQGARRNGIRCIGVVYGYGGSRELLDAGADQLAKNVRTLERLLLNKRNKKNRTEKEREVLEFRQNNQSPAPSKSSMEKKHPDPGKLSDWIPVFYPLILYYILYQLFLLLLAVAVDEICVRLGWESWMITNSNMLAAGMNVVSILLATLFLIKHFFQEMPGDFYPGVDTLFTACRRNIRYLSAPMKKMTSVMAPVIILSLAATLFSQILLQLIPISALKASDTVNNQLSVPFAMAIVSYVFVTPLAEEIIFRGILYNRLKKRIPVVYAILIQGILFGIYHGNIVQGIYGMIMGILLGFVYWTSDDFKAPLLFHQMANLFVVVLAFTGVWKDSWTTVKICTIFGMMALGAGMVLYKEKKAE